MKLSAILIDDEQNAIETLSLMLTKFCPEVTILATANSLLEGITELSLEQPDLLFLDIQLKQQTGFDLLEKIDLPETALVFVTAYEHYAIQAIKVGAVDYLLKPIHPDELIKTVNKVLKNKIERQSQPANTLPPDQSILLPVKKQYHKVYLSEIIYLEASNTYCTIYTNERNYVCSKPIKFMEERLPDKLFYRVHQKYIVNLNYVSSIMIGRDQPLILENGAQIPIARNRRKDLMEQLNLMS